MWRHKTIHSIQTTEEPFDVFVIGGGATGLGIAVDAASRGYSTLLLERDDFAKGTSSRSTKLAHGGVRYLAQGNVRLVLEALRERGLMRRNAPVLVRDLPFIVPAYQWWEIPFYLIGLKLYDVLAGKRSLGKSRFLSASTVLEKIPSIRKNGLKGGIVYYDGQFDDSRMAVSLARTAELQGARVLNYAEPIRIEKNDAQDIYHMTIQDHISDQKISIEAKSVFNATGVFVDNVPRTDSEARKPLIAPSRGAHIVVDQRFLHGHHGLMIPKTTDGRILFTIPWYGKALIGTTDTPVERTDKEPLPSSDEVKFILDTARAYLHPSPREDDILAVFAGLRPLAAPQDSGKKTKEISRGHRILVMEDQTITIIGGKWTTYRQMAEDALDRAISIGRLPEKPCRTEDLTVWVSEIDRKYGLGVGGEGEVKAEVEAEVEVEEQTSNDKPQTAAGHQTPAGPEGKGSLMAGYPWTEEDVRYMIREEYAMKIEDLLSRRMRILVLDAQQAIQIAPVIADILEQELGTDNYNKAEDLQSFFELAKNYTWKTSEF